MFDVRYYFCRHGSENIYSMTKEMFKLAFDTEIKIAYVYKAKDEMTKNHQECDNPVVTGFMPQMLNADGTVNKLCPVRSYENYVVRLSEICPFLWQTPNDAAFQKGQHFWYKNKRIGGNTLGQFLTDLCKDIPELKKKYTNHCLRVTGMTNLTHCNFTNRQIMSVTGHKSLQSLSMYQRVKADEKMMMGMSLAYSLKNPIEVQNALKDVHNFEVYQPTPAPLHLLHDQQDQEKEALNPTAQNFLPLESALTPYQPTKQVPEDYDFDLMDIINEVNKQELVIVASQVEASYAANTVKANSSTTSLIKNNSQHQAGLSASPFSNCRIGSIRTININIYKQ